MALSVARAFSNPDMEPFGISQDFASSAETCSNTTTLYNKFLSLDNTGKHTRDTEETKAECGSELQTFDSVSDISSTVSKSMEEPQSEKVLNNEFNIDDNIREQPPEPHYDERSSDNEISFEPALSREDDVIIMTMTMTSVDSQMPKTSTPKNRLPSPTKKMLMNANVCNGFSSSSPSPRITSRTPSPSKFKKLETLPAGNQENTSASGAINVFNGRTTTPGKPNIQVKPSTNGNSEKSSKPVAIPNKATPVESDVANKSQSIQKGATGSKISKPPARMGRSSSSPPKPSTTKSGQTESIPGPNSSVATTTAATTRSASPSLVKKSATTSGSPLPRVASLQAGKAKGPTQQPVSVVKDRKSTPLRSPSPGSKSFSSSAVNSRAPRPSKNPVLAERRANAAATSLPTSFKASVASTSSKNSSERSEPSAKDNVAPSLQNEILIRPSDWNSSEKCMKADYYYDERLKMAWEKGVISIMSSLLSKEDETTLQGLSSYCKTSKVKLAITESFQRQKTTICVLPVAPTLSVSTLDPTTVNTVADRRSLRAMEAMLHGVPIVTPDWISACHRESKIIMPTTSMFIRSLPSKTLPVASESSADFGVAFLAAAIDASRGKYKPLSNVSIYLCGFSARKQGEVSALLRDAGAREVLTKSPAAVDRLQNLRNTASYDQKLIFLCNDTNVVISPELEQQIKEFCKHSSFTRGQVSFVNTNWLYDSITCGAAVDLKRETDSYKPTGGKGLELHNVIQRYCDIADGNPEAISPTLDAKG